MADRNPHSAVETHQLSHQQDESKGRIKRPQRQDRDMQDVARGSEPERRDAGRGRKV